MKKEQTTILDNKIKSMKYLIISEEDFRKQLDASKQLETVLVMAVLTYKSHILTLTEENIYDKAMKAYPPLEGVQSPEDVEKQISKRIGYMEALKNLLL